MNHRRIVGGLIDNISGALKVNPLWLQCQKCWKKNKPFKSSGKVVFPNRTPVVIKSLKKSLNPQLFCHTFTQLNSWTQFSLFEHYFLLYAHKCYTPLDTHTLNTHNIHLNCLFKKYKVVLPAVKNISYCIIKNIFNTN